MSLHIIIYIIVNINNRHGCPYTLVNIYSSYHSNKLLIIIHGCPQDKILEVVVAVKVVVVVVVEVAIV